MTNIFVTSPESPADSELNTRWTTDDLIIFFCLPKSTFSITGWSLFASQWLSMPSIEETFTLHHFWETSTKQAISQKVFFLCPEKKLSNTVESIYLLRLLEVTRKKWYCKQYFRLPPNNNVPIMLCASWMSSRRTDPRFPPTIWFFQTYWPRTKSFLYLFQSCFCFRS